MIELQHLCYDVEQDGELKHILKDISLTIDERFVAITGPNGGGKSTLAKVIAGILPPTQGRILFGRRGHHRSVHHRAGPHGASALRSNSRCALRG